MLCKKGLCKINEVGDYPVVCIRPEAGKFKAVACLRLACSSFLMLLFGIPSGTVRIVFCVRAIGNDKDLNILIQSTARPERFSLITVNLVNCLANRNASSPQPNVPERQAVDQYRNIIAVVMFCAILFADHILVDNLQSVIMYVCFINQCNILGFPTITL